MSKKEKRVLRYEGEFDPSRVLAGIQQIQNKLNSSNVSTDISKDYTNKLKKLEEKTTKIMSKINKGFSSQSEISGFEKELIDVFSQLQTITQNFNTQKIDFDDIILTDEVQKKLDNLNTDIKNFKKNLEDLTSLQVQKLGKTNILTQAEVEKVNKTLNIKDSVTRKQQLDVVRGDLEANHSSEILSDSELEKYNASLGEINKNLEEAIKRRNEFLKDFPQDAEKELEELTQHFQAIRDLINQNPANQGKGAKNPINKDLSLHAGYKGDLTYTLDGKDYTITQEQYNQELAKLKEIENAIKVNKNIQKDIDGLEKQKKETEEILQNHKEANKELKLITALFDIIKGNTEGLDDDTKVVLQDFIDWNTNIKNTTKSLQDAEKEVEDIKEEATTAAKNSFKDMSKKAEELGNSTEKAAEGVNGLRDGMDKLENESKFFNDLQNRIGMVLDLGSAFNYAQRAISFTFNTIKELDAAFTEIAVVTSQTNAQLWDSFDTYNDMAQRLGITTQDAIKTSALYYQQGLDTAEVMTLTEETIKMARIAGMDFADATDRMTAALRGFKLEMQDASRVNDVFSALAAESAVDTDELSYALTKTASIAASAGMELETTSAFLSQMIETTREAPENIGTAMKTIVARFQELKKNVGEIEVDGEIVDVNKIDTALKGVGISLRDSVTGQFRDLDDVFLELSSKWNTLDRNTQRYVATVAAGSRQQSRFLAMMDNYERTIELVNIANESSGASAVQFDKTLGSIDSKINKIKASGEEIVGNLANNQFIKDTLDFANKIMQTFAKISESGSIAMLTFAAVAYKVIKNIVNGGIDGIKLVAKEYDKLTKQIKTKTETTHEHTHIHKHIDTNGNPVDPVNGQPTSTSQNSGVTNNNPQGKLVDTPQKTNKEIREGAQIASSIAKTLGSILSVVNLISTQSTSGMVGSTVGQGVGGAVGSLVSTLSMSGALGPWGMVVGPLIGPITGMIGGAIGDAIDRSKGVLSEAYQKSLDKFKEELNQQKIDFDEEHSNFLELAEEYDNLNSKTELTVEETRRLNEINQELYEAHGINGKYVNEETGQIVINNEKLKERIKNLKEESAALQTKTNVTDFLDKVKDAKATKDTEINEIEKQVFDYKKSFYEVIPGGKGAINYIEELDSLTPSDVVGYFSTIINNTDLSSEEKNEALKTYLNNLPQDFGSVENFENYIEKIKNIIENTSDKIKYEYSTEIAKSEEKYDNKIKEGSTINDDLVSAYIQNSEEDILNKYSSILQKAIDTEMNYDYTKFFDKNGETLDPNSEEFKKLYEEYEKQVLAAFNTLKNDFINLNTNQQDALKIAQSLIGIEGITEEDIKNYLNEASIPETIQNAFYDTYKDNINFGNLDVGISAEIGKLAKKDNYKDAAFLANVTSEFSEGEKDLDNYSNKLKLLEERFGENSDAVNLFKEYAQKNLSSFGYTLEQTSKQVEGLNTRIKSLRDMETAAIQGTLSTEQMNTLIDKYGLSNNNFEQTENGLKLVGIGIQEIIDREEELAKIDAFERLNAQIEIYNSLGAASTKEALGKTTAVLVDGNIKFYKTAKDIVEALEKNEITMDDLTEEEKEFISATVEAKNGVNALSKEIKGLNEATKNNYFGPFIDGLKSIDNLSSKIQISSNAIKEFNENGQISLDTALGLISANEDYVQAIEVKNGILTLNKEKIQDIANSEKEALKQEFTFSKKRIEAENKVLDNLIIAETNKISTINQSLTDKVNTYEDFDKVLVDVEKSYNETLLGEEQTLQGAIGEKIAEGADDQLGILSDRAKEEAKIIEEMASNWEKYYAASNGEDVEINTNIKTPKEILSTFKFDKNYYKRYAENLTDYSIYFKKTFGENMTEDMLYSTYGADFVAHIKKEIATYTENGVSEAVAIEQTLLKIKADAQARLDQLKNKHTGNKKMIDYYGKQIELLDNFNFLSTGGKSESSKSNDQKEYNLELDKFYNILSKIAQAQRDINELDRERENYSNYEELAEIDAKRLSASKMLEEHYRTLLNMQKKERKNLESQLAQYSKYVTIRDGYLQVNHNAIAGITDEEFGNTLKDLIDSYDDLSAAIEDTNGNLQEQEKNQKKIVESGREYAQTLKDKLLQMVIKIHEEEIQAVKDKYEAIKKADDDYLSTLRKNIQKQRDLRNQKDEEEELSKMEKRLTLLRRDTSGIYANEIVQLEEEIAQKRQDMADQQQDQIIQEIEDEQKAQQEKMDQETEFLDAQHQENLDSMTAYWAEVEEIMKGGYDSILEYLQTHDEEFITGSEEAQTSWLDTWKKNIDEALAYKKLTEDSPEVADSKSDTKVGTGKSSATDTTKQNTQETTSKETPKETTSKETPKEPKKTKPENGELVTLEKGKKLYSGTGDTKGVNPTFGAGPYTVLKTSGNRVQVRVKGAKAGITGWLNINDLVGYSAGGYVTETGPVMVHGTPNKPEAFLSAADVKLIEGLKDSLRYITKTRDNSLNNTISEKNGDIYYEIHIEVDELNSDYSVNEMMAAIEKKIVNDARGRNVIAIKRSR